MDPHSETKARILEKTVEQLAKMEVPGVKFSNEGLSLTTEMLRIYTLEAAHRAAAQTKAEGGTDVEVEHIQNRDHDKVHYDMIKYVIMHDQQPDHSYDQHIIPMINSLSEHEQHIHA